MRRTVALLLLFVAGAACGEDPISPGEPSTVPLTVLNRSLFELLEVRFHEAPGYAGAVNVLPDPLAHDATVELDFVSGEYVTVIRRRTEGGERIAFTTAWPLEVPSEGYVLVVFQEQFRLEEP